MDGKQATCWVVFVNDTFFFAHEKFIQPLNYMVRFFCTLYNDDDDDDSEYGTEKKGGEAY